MPSNGQFTQSRAALTKRVVGPYEIKKEGHLLRRSG